MKLWKIYVLLLLLQSSYKIGDGYQSVSLQDYLCADIFGNKMMRLFRPSPLLKLTEGNDSAAIITQVWDTTMTGLHSSSKLKYDCKFHVEMIHKQPHGIYTVITKLKFRRDLISGNCLDYIEFSSGNRPPSGRICSDTSSDDPAVHLIFDQRDHDITVHIHIDKSHMIVEPLELNMVLIAHPECSCIGDIFCNPKYKYSCISRNYVSHQQTTRFHTANVASSVNTSLIFTWIAMGFCVWIHTIVFQHISIRNIAS